MSPEDCETVLFEHLRLLHGMHFGTAKTLLKVGTVTEKTGDI